MANYYVDFTLGNDGDTGTIGHPWKTADKVSDEFKAGNFNPGDNIYFKRGETWAMAALDDTLEIEGSSGTIGSHITVGAYGTGNAPIFDGGANNISLISHHVGDPNANYITIQDLELTGTDDARMMAIESCNHWRFENLYLHDNSAPEEGPTSSALSLRYNARWMWVVDCIIENIDGGEGIYVSHADDASDLSRSIFIDGCAMTSCDMEGFDIKQAGRSVFLWDCIFTGNGSEGLTQLAAGGRHCVVYQCRFDQTASGCNSGIYLGRYADTDGIETGHEWHIERCLFTDQTGDYGAINFKGENNTVANCTMVDCSRGIRCDSNDGGNVIKNCIFEGTIGYEVYFDGGVNENNWTFDYNDYGDGGTGVWYYGAARDLSYVQGTLNQEADAISSDPSFAETVDYTINGGSPCVNIGDASVTVYDWNQEYMGTGAPDMGWQEYNWLRPHRTFVSLIDDDTFSRFTGYTGVVANDDVVYAGSYSIQVPITDATARYAYRTGLGNIKHFFADFEVNAGDLTMANGDLFNVWEGRTAGNSAYAVIQLYYDGSDIQVRGGLQDDASAWSYTSYFNLEDGWNHVQFFWRAAPDVGLNHGEFALWLNEVERAHLEDKNNHDNTIDRFYIGAVSGLDAGTSGNLYFDVPRIDWVRYMDEYEYGPSPPDGNGNGDGNGGPVEEGGAGGITDVLVCARPWRLIEPDPTTNMVLNPSAEIAGNFAAVVGASMERTTAQSLYGYNSFRIQTAANNQGASWTLQTLSNATHYVTLRMRGSRPQRWTWSLGGRSKVPELLDVIDDDWLLYGVFFTAAQSNGSTTLYVRQSGTGTADFYVDGVQVEAKDHWTTICIGDLEGCEWNGAEHASTSSRSAQSRAGGRVRDLWEDYGFFVEESVGAGAAEVDVGVRGYAFLPGGALTGIKTQSRQFTLVGRFVAESERDLHANRQALLKVVSDTSYPGSQPVRVRYRGAETQKEISGHYEGGLEGRLKASYGPFQVESDTEWMKAERWTERATVRFKAADPLWYQVGQSAQVLDTNDGATTRYIAARLRSTGQWDNLGPPSSGGDVEVIAEDGTYVYVGGAFNNWNGIGAADNIVRYEKATGTWSAMGAGLDGTVFTIAIAPDGDVYLGGNFTDVSGGPGGTYSYVVRWDGAAYNAVGAGLDNSVSIMVFDLVGDLYIGGLFTDVLGGPGGTYNRIVRWDGAAYNAVGAGMNGGVYGLTVGLDGMIYLGGNFTDVQGGPGGTYNYIAGWNGAAYSALGTGMNGIVQDLATASNGIIYVGGRFTTSGGVTTNYIAQWNGMVWSALGSGTDNNVMELDVSPDGILYIGGVFTQAGGITLADYIAKWNGATWAHLDIDLPGSPTIYAVYVGKQDPVIKQNYDLWIGYNTSGTTYFAGSITATNNGTMEAYPAIIIERSGGTSATVEQIRNETIGKVLLFDYDLLDGETLTIDLQPTRKSIVSNFFGPRPDAILANSDFGSWVLQPGDNQVTAFVDVAGAPTVTARMVWRDSYRSLD